MMQKQTIFWSGRNISQPLDVIDGATQDVLRAGGTIDPFSLQPIEEPLDCTFRRERTTLATVEYTLCDMAGVDFGIITLTKLAGNLTKVFFGLFPELGELHIPRWELIGGIRDRLNELIDNTAKYAKFMEQAALPEPSRARETKEPAQEIAQEKGKPGRLHFYDDVWAWGEVNMLRRNKPDVENLWKKLILSHGRDLQDPGRQFEKIVKKKWL